MQVGSGRGTARAGRGELVAVGAMLAVLLLQLFLAQERMSMSWDEGHHLFDGYTILRHGDYGLNPEVPPLAKVAAALPLLPMRLYEPVQQGRSSQLEAFTDGRDFLFRNDANALLRRGRMAIALFTITLALLVYLMGRRLFGRDTGLLALAFLMFDPTLLAHGALVTTDAAISCCVFAAVFAWMAYTWRPTGTRLVVAGLMVGLALAVKFTGLLLVPVVGLLALTEAVERRSARLLMWRLGAALAVFCLGFAVLWASYGFRYRARPEPLVQNPALTQYLREYAAVGSPRLLDGMARLHLLPEGYLWGLANTKLTEERDVSYLFGTIRRHGTWRYFPTAMLIKSTIPFLVLLVVAVGAGWRWPKLRREWAPLLVPVAIFLGVAMRSDMNIGVRHILPIYPFLYLVGASALSVLMARDRRWVGVAVTLLVFQAVSSLRAYPKYMAYANEAWGGPDEVHRYLSDSNSDWGQQLKTAAAYLREHQVGDCWMAYTASGVVEESYYGVRCRPLPTAVNLWWIKVPMEVPKEVEGTVLISDDELEGVDLPAGQRSPYADFKRLKPDAVLDGGMFVYRGRFDLSAAAALVATAQGR